MVKLCLMASQGYVPGGFVFHPELGLRRLSQGYQPLLLGPGSSQDMRRPGLLAVEPYGHHGQRKLTGRMLDSDQLVTVDSNVINPVLIDVQDTRPNSILFSFGISNQCAKQQKILEFLTSGSNEVEKGGVDLSVLTDLMGLQAMPTEMPQHPYAPDYGLCFQDDMSKHALFYPSNKFYSMSPPLHMVGDLACKSELLVPQDSQVGFSGSHTEMKDIFAIIAEFYMSRNSTMWRKRSLLVPWFERLKGSKARANLHGSLKFETVNAVPLKSPQKTKLRPSTKKTASHRVGKERELQGKNYLHSCECLLSIIVDKKRHGKTAIQELKKSGPKLTPLLTQFSASIAGTGLALIFSVVCKVASGRVPFCTSKLLNTGLGLGLVWLSWAVNKMRDTIIHISKNSGKWALNEDEMMNNLDTSVKEIYFRAATLMAIMFLRLA